MAETRKFEQPISAIGDAVRAALDDIRPTTPGTHPVSTSAQPAEPPTAATFGLLESLPDFFMSPSNPES